MVCTLDTKDAACLHMAMEGVYLVCSETLVFLLFVGGMISLIIEDWQSQCVGFVMFYFSNVASFFVLASCTCAVFQGYLHRSVLLIARGALIFNVVIFGSFLLTANEWQDSVQMHKMHPLLFKSSLQDSSGLTMSYLVVGISVCAILLLLHCCIYQQLHEVVVEAQSQTQYKMYAYVNRVAESGIDDHSPDATEADTDSATLRRILKLFADVQAETELDSETMLELLQVVVRTFLLVLCVLYDTKACLEDKTKNGYLELSPSIVFISSLALGDGMHYAYVSWQQRSMWRTMLFCLLMSYALGYAGVVGGTVLFYVNEDWQSSFLSDTRRTWLNNAFVGFLVLDLVLYLYGGFRLSRHRNRVHPTTTEQPAEGRQQSAQGPSQILATSGTSLGGSIRVVGFANARHTAFDMSQAYKKNK
jgi:hypothetical protein